MRSRYFLLILFVIACWIGCVEDTELEEGIRNAKAPTVETYEILESTASSVTVSGEVTQENGASVTESGFCWSVESSFTLTDGDSKAVSSGKAAFEATIEDLTSNQDYYIRAYAINAVDTAYGSILSFTTADGLGSVRTTEPLNVMSTTAQCGGVITVEGAAEVEERGVYLMRDSLISSADSLILCDMEADSFYCVITDLEPLTTYYVRAYARNKYGSYNGASILSFTTTSGYPVMNDESFELVTLDYTYAEFSMEVTSEGDSAILACGFCYGTEKYPTIETADTVVCGAGIGVFTGKIEDMQQQVEYYVRAFATNSVGTVYSEGEGISTTLVNELPTVTTNTVSRMQNGSVWVGGVVTAEGSSSVTESGVCWSTTAGVSLENCEGSMAISSGAHSFTSILTGMKGSVTYYLSAYATNEKGTAYGDEVSFSTPDIFGDEIAFDGGYLVAGSASFCTWLNSVGFLLGGDAGDAYTNKLWGYLTSRDEWVSLKSQPESLSGQSVFCVGLGMWAFGGEDNSSAISDKLYLYSTVDNTWEEMEDDTDRPQGTFRSAACSLDNVGYLIGGRRDDDLLNNVWAYDASSYTWSEKADFPVAQYGGIAVVINDRIYAGLGIIDRSKASVTYTTRLWSADSELDNWDKETSFPGEAILAAVAYDDCIYGVDDEGYIWCYDTMTEEWTQKSQLPSDYQTVHCMYTLNDYIYIGLGDASALIAYDPTWDN